LIRAAQKEFKTRLGDREYKPLFPDEVSVPLEINREIMEKYRPLLEQRLSSSIP
jgi:hypothetical protein